MKLCFVDLIMVIKASMFFVVFELQENNDRKQPANQKEPYIKGPISSRLTRDYDETRLTNSSNVKLSISVHY
jgi:hypothetical protein